MGAGDNSQEEEATLSAVGPAPDATCETAVGVGAHARAGQIDDAGASNDGTVTMAGGGDPLAAGPVEIAGRYHVVGEIGRGGMGVVHRALDVRLGRLVALKLVQSSTVRRNRLMREAQALAQLAHPNVVPVYDVGVVDNTVYMAMELIDGVDVRRWLADERRAPADVLRVFAAAGDGLAAAHAAGLVHRDFKPANVIIGADGRVRVLDFGLARAMPSAESESSATGPAPPSDDSIDADSAVGARRDANADDGPDGPDGDDPAVSHASRLGAVPIDARRAALLESSLTRVGHIVGTPRYMAPEQRRGAATDARTDQFSFCFALYEALYDDRPFLTREARRRFDADGTPPIVPPPRRDVPRHVRRALARGLRWNPSERFASMNLLVAELRRDIRGARIRIALAIAGVAAVAITTAVALTAGGEPCGGAIERARAVWPSDLRAAVQKGLLGTGSRQAPWMTARLLSDVDGYMLAWADQRTQACRATRVHGEQSEASMERRMRCLDDHLAQVQSFLRALAGAPTESAMNRASSELARIGALELCADAAALARRQQEPIKAAEVATVAALGPVVRELTALNAVYNEKAAEPIAKRVLELARRTTHAATRGQALFAYAEAARLRGALAEHSAMLGEVLTLAAQARNPTLLADAWSSLLWQVGVEERRPLATEELLRASEIALLLAADEPERGRLQVEVGHVIATVYLHLGRLAESERRFRQLLVQPQHQTRLSATSFNLALVLTYLDRLDEARVFLARSREIDQQTYGDTRPYFGDDALNLGLTYHWQGDLITAERWYRAAVAHSLDRDGEANQNPLYQLYLGHVLLDRGAYDEAQRLLDAAFAGFTASLGADAELTRHVRVQRARLHLARGQVAAARADIDAVFAGEVRTGTVDRLAPGYVDSRIVGARVSLAEGALGDAEAALRRSLERYHQLYGPRRLAVSEPHLALAELALAARRYPDAIAAADQALEILGAAGSVTFDPRRAEALFLRARARTARDGRSADSQRDASAAVAIWQAMAPAHPRVAELRAWLARR